MFDGFDLDKDGYVSRKDLTTRLKEMNLLNPRETEIFINYIDHDNKESLNFKDFS